MGSYRPLKVTHKGFWDLTDVTLADEDTDVSNQYHAANKAIPNNMAMQMVLPGDQIWK